MTEINAKVICDSVTTAGHRLTTIEAEFPRCILAEVNTHRVFSRNSASSRAIPVEKMIKRVMEDPFVPLYWGKNQSGMQASGEVEDKPRADRMWRLASQQAVASAMKLHDVGLHKQIVNRVLEPFLWHKAIISSTEWVNFLSQRDHEAAEPHMRILAKCIRAALAGSSPKLLDTGQWHTPYVDPETDRNMSTLETCMVSAARCARVSYLTHNGQRDTGEDIRLCRKLAEAYPPHASPFEHVATPNDARVPGNFKGWLQLRHSRLVWSYLEALQAQE